MAKILNGKVMAAILAPNANIIIIKIIKDEIAFINRSN